VRLRQVPITIREANAYVARWHRHNRPTRGGLFALGAVRDGAVEPCGVCIVGRPVARRLQDGRTAEVTRLASDGTRDVCSFLYGAAKRAAQSLGYRRLITYTLTTESGASLRAVGATPTHRVRAANWDRPGRRRSDQHTIADRQCWLLFDTEAA
jgi:hypothetical protein